MITGDRIKKARKYKGYTQKELGLKLGISQSAIGQFEKGCNITGSTMNRIAKALDLGISYSKSGEPYFYDFIDTVYTGTPEEEKTIKFNTEQLEGIDDDFGHDQPSGYNDFLNSYAKHAFNNSSNGMELQIVATSDGLLHDGESKILKSYDKLNTGGKLEAIKRVEELTLIEKYTRKDDDGNNE